MTNRVTPYAGGWLTFLIRQGICTEEQAREAGGGREQGGEPAQCGGRRKGTHVLNARRPPG